jgi:chromosome segregation ATPase
LREELKGLEQKLRQSDALVLAVREEPQKELEKARRQIETQIQEQESLRGRFQTLDQMRSRLANEVEQGKTALRDTDQRSRAEVSRLAQSLEKAKQDQEGAARRIEELLAQARDQQARCEQQDARETEHARELASTRQELQNARKKIQEAVAERQAMQAQMEKVRRQLAGEQATLQGTLDAVRREALTLREEKEALSGRVESLMRERDELAAGHGGLKEVLKEAEKRAQADTTRLTAALGESRKLHEAVLAENKKTTESLRTAQAEGKQLMERESESRAESAKAQEKLKEALFVQREYADKLAAVEKQLREEATRSNSDRENWTRQLDAARRQADQERVAHQAAINKSSEELQSLRKQHDSLLAEVETLRQERSDLAAQHDRAGSSMQEMDEAFSEIERLTKELQESRRQHQIVSRENERLAEQLQELQAHLAQPAVPLPRTVGRHPLESQPDIDRESPERDRGTRSGPEKTRIDLERQLTEVRNRLKAATERAEKMAAETRIAQTNRKPN